MLSCLLGFIVSKIGIMVYPLKVEVIVQIPPSCTVPQLQSLHGKDNFLRGFVSNYTMGKITFFGVLSQITPISQKG
jgi:hypothetical protein